MEQKIFQLLLGENDNQWGTCYYRKEIFCGSLSNVEIEGGTGAKYLGLIFF